MPDTQDDTFRDPLFEPPEDLVCPITHAVFRSPVVTTVGTVYDEAAIRQHLEVSSIDPLSNQHITSKQLIPVYLLRSRAKQYAVSTAKACVARVLSSSCQEPARFLRRACDLCDEADVLDSVPSLPIKVVSFALSHRAKVHDVFILMQFATSLAEAGHTEDALTLYATLLRIERDQPVQRAVVKRCLEHCWGTNWDTVTGDSGAVRAFADAATKAERAAGSRTRTSAESSNRAVHDHRDLAHASPEGGASTSLRCGERSSWAVQVASFVRAQQGMSASEFVDVLQGMGVPRHELLAVCAELLDPSRKASSQVTQSASEDAAAAAFALVPAMMQLHASQLMHDVAAARDAARARLPAARAADASALLGRGASRRPGWWQLHGGRALAMGSSVLGVLMPGLPGRALSSGAVVWLASRIRSSSEAIEEE